LIGRVHLWLGDITNAKQHLYEAELAIEGNQNEIANAVPKRLSAQIASREGNYELAHGLLTDVLKSAPLTVDDEGRAATLIELGIVAGQQQSWQDAKTYFEEALKLDERLATLEGQAVSLSHLGNAQLSMGEHSVATRSFLRGLELATQVDRLSTKGRCQYGLAQVNLTIGEIEISKQYARAAVESFTKLGMKDMVDAALMLVSDQ
jgi:tetratricopeptide (TPR) repeat protein